MEYSQHSCPEFILWLVLILQLFCNSGHNFVNLLCLLIFNEVCFVDITQFNLNLKQKMITELIPQSECVVLSPA